MLVEEFNRKEERLGMEKGMCDSTRFLRKGVGWVAGDRVGISHQQKAAHFLRVSHSMLILLATQASEFEIP